MPFCGYCGNKLSDSDKFCAGCGKPAGGQSGNEQSSPKITMEQAVKTTQKSAELIQKGLKAYNNVRQVNAPDAIGETNFEMTGFNADLLNNL